MDLTSSKELLLKAVKSLKKRIASKAKKDSKKHLKQLFSDDGPDSNAKVSLVVSLIKIPAIPRDGKVRSITIRSKLPHSFIDDLTDILLLTRDIKGYRRRNSDYNHSVHAHKDLLKEHNALGLVTDIITYKQLVTENRNYENQRNLCTQFDVVLCDNAIHHKVASCLGKPFFKAKKRPIAINMRANDLREEILSNLSKSYLHLDLKGSCGMTQVARLNQTDDEIVENILATIEEWKEKLPGCWVNVRSIHLKTETSESIPLFMSLVTPNKVMDVVHPNLEEDESLAIDHLSTLKGNEVVEVMKSGEVRVLPAKKDERKRALEEMEQTTLAEEPRYDPTERKIVLGKRAIKFNPKLGLSLKTLKEEITAAKTPAPRKRYLGKKEVKQMEKSVQPIKGRKKLKSSIEKPVAASATRRNRRRSNPK